MHITRVGWEDGLTYIRQVTELHVAEIHHGALPLLGTAFMTRLYRELARTPGCGVWVALDGRQMTAFLIGSADVRAGFRSVLRRAGLGLCLRSLPRLASRSLLQKLPALALYPFRRPAETTVSRPRAELLAIAVAPAYRGQGLGRALIDGFEKFLQGQGAIEAYGVSTNAADPASNAFYRRLGFEAIGDCPHHHLTLRHYRKGLSAPLATCAGARGLGD